MRELLPHDQETGHGLVLTLSCADRPGIVHAVSGFLLERGFSILDSQQYGDPQTGRFFLRVHVGPADGAAGTDLAGTRAAFGAVAERFGVTWRLVDAGTRTRMLVLVSRYGHCLNDLLFRCSTGALPVEVAAVVSNHTDFARLSAGYDVPFHHVPVTPQTKPAAEARLLDLVREHDVDLVVLARYMQVLSDTACSALAGRAINIHHSMLPSFKGARPYHQAYERGVKVIGATAHYVTPDLDEGPIIEQEVARVDHSMSPAEVTALGRDVECQALARAVRWHAEARVLLNGTRTVVLR